MSHESIKSDAQFRRYSALVEALERKVKAGTATEVDRAKLRSWREFVLIYTWGQNERPAEPVVRREPPPADAQAFLAWYRRNRNSKPWRATDWWAALLYWWHPREPDALGEDVIAALEEELDRWEDANAGMVVTNLEAA